MAEKLEKKITGVNRRINCSFLRMKYKLWDRYLGNNNSGMGVVEVILIIVVLVGLVLIFKTKLTSVVNSIFNTINSKVGSFR